ncbi:MAG: hypothetical protein GY819_10045, partial [Planctomycetaceae bacterium]|nr:hypothetical protein [Planctomycetaceae bacterium]
ALIYTALAIWCSLQPAITSEKVGFTLQGDSGKSEFMTVYGGLELGLALVLFACVFRPEFTIPGVLACVLIHGSLVVFRTISLVLYPAVEPLTWRLAAGEWGILLAGCAILWFSRSAQN